jgi:hypothetical protein
MAISWFDTPEGRSRPVMPRVCVPGATPLVESDDCDFEWSRNYS